MPSEGSHISLEPLLNNWRSILALAGYQISDQEVTGSTSYYGYLDKDGKWYIMRAVISSTVTAYTYAAGADGYDFSNRAAESYASFDTTF